MTWLKGDVVQATEVITDVGVDGEPYIHALPGTYGIVLCVDGAWLTIRWYLPGQGVCDTPTSVLRKVPHFQVVDDY